MPVVPRLRAAKVNAHAIKRKGAVGSARRISGVLGRS